MTGNVHDCAILVIKKTELFILPIKITCTIGLHNHNVTALITTVLGL